MKVERIDPVILFVKDFQASVKFYRDLGFEQSASGGSGESHAGYVEFKVGSQTFALHGGYSGPVKGPVALHFVVDNIEEMVAELRGKGLKPVEEVTQHPWGYEVTYIDPNGYEVEFVQPVGRN
ncbi:MAG: VOC family protein [Thermoprotei archaeon]